MLIRSLIIAAVAAAPAFAQGSPAPAAGDNPNMANARLLWTQVRSYITRAADQVPESTYTFRPTPEVRTFGELVAHVAGSQYAYCAAALGEKERAEDAVEQTAKTKAAIVQALKESNEYCGRAYAQTDAAAAKMADVFGAQRSRMIALLQNATHDNEHYGNMVTYMRINHMVPPSSQPRSSGQ
jgi:uncharacterized damage-inducible protein DinB